MLQKRRPLQHRPKTLDLKTFKAPSFPTESSSQAQLDFEDQNAGPYLKAKYFKTFSLDKILSRTRQVLSTVFKKLMLKFSAIMTTKF